MTEAEPPRAPDARNGVDDRDLGAAVARARADHGFVQLLADVVARDEEILGRLAAAPTGAEGSTGDGPNAAVDERRGVIDDVVDDVLVRYRDALGRLGDPDL